MEDKLTKTIFDSIKFDEKGLIGAIIQDSTTKQVLMFAWMNKESLEKTVRDGKCWYYSRSREKLWLKGEMSGHFQIFKSIKIDCDGDALLIEVEQIGGACHTGHYSCFYRQLEGKKWIEKEKKVFDEKKVYKNKAV